jgi:hypothetical protein
MKKIILTFFALLLLSSCASKLRVEVQVAERDLIIKEDAKYPKDYNHKAGIAGLQLFIRNWPSDETLNSIFNFVKAKMKSELDEDLKEDYKMALLEKLVEIEQLKDNAIVNYANKDLPAVENNLNIASIKIEDLRTLLVKYNVLVPQYIDSNIDINNLSINIAVTKQAVTEGTERTRYPILGDELAPFIAQDKNKKVLWKSVFNKTVSSNFLGNADIAMILRSNPPEREMRSGDYNNNFTIKGVRNDAADASNALITGLTQTINFIANTQGIPTNITTTSVDNPTPVENPLVTGMEADRKKLELKKAKLIELRRMLIEKIELENVNSRKTDAEIKASAKRITEFWEALKIELNKP